MSPIASEQGRGEHHAYLFFSTSPIASFFSRSIRLFTGSPLTHVAIGDAEVVFEHGLTQTRFWPLWAYAKGYPSLRWIVRLPTPYPINIQRLEGTGPKQSWHVALWWLTAGQIPSQTGCVAIAVHALWLAGVRVPRRILTPRSLLEWCIEKGYEAEAC